MLPHDIERLVALSAPTVSPDGTTVVVGAARPDLGADAVVGQLWIAPVDGSAPPRRLTRGRRDTAPAFSPDGGLIAFTRLVDGKPQLHVVDAAGGEPLALTEAPLGVGEFRWSPDGELIAYLARVPEQGRYGTVEGLDAAAEPARRLDALKATANGVGYVVDRRVHLHVVALPDLGAEPAYALAPDADGPLEPLPAVPPSLRLTEGDADHASPVFSPDGATIAVVSARHDGRDDDLRSAVLLVPVPTEEEADDADVEPRALPAHPSTADLSLQRLAWLPGGLHATAVDVGPTGLDFVGRHAGLYRIDGDGAAVRLTDAGFDVADGARPVEAEGRILLARRTRGRVVLEALSADGSTETVLDGDVEVHDVAVGGDAVIAVVGDPTTYGELVDVRTGEALTDFGSLLADGVAIAPQRELEAVAPDGYPVHGWLSVPEGEGPHPVLLLIHGGPFAAYTVGLFDEVQVYTEAGYAVVYGNPRGSAGYGEEHGRSIRQRMGTDDLADVLALLEHAIATEPRLDGERLGILGGSYGGYLTAWTIAHDHRFAGAIVERGFLDPDAFIGTSDIGSYFGDEYVGTDPQQVAAQSPQAVVAQVRTPTLVIHSELDLRCPLPQAQRYFASLRRAGVPSSLLVFPGEDHELSRSGRPRHRLQRFEAILDWWAEHLPVR